MIELTKDNFRLFAMKHYDNHSCLSEKEFDSDLTQLVTLRRTMSWYINGRESNLRLMVNNIIIFYNCFEHHAATRMLQFSIDAEHVEYFNAVLKFLSLPMLIPPEQINSQFYQTLQGVFK
jgi:hypothetical protein